MSVSLFSPRATLKICKISIQERKFEDSSPLSNRTDSRFGATSFSLRFGLGQQSSTPTNAIITGALPIAQSRVDICSCIPLLGSCPIALALSEHYTQPLSVQSQVALDELQPQMSESTQVSVIPGTPNLVLDLNFSLGAKSYDYSIPLPALQAPGVFAVNIPLSQILANLVGLGLPASLLGKFISLNLPVSLVSSVQADVAIAGFTSSQQTLIWNTPSTASYNGSLTGTLNDSYINLSQFRSVFSVSAQFILGLPLIAPIRLFSFDKDFLNFGSSNSFPIGHWYQVAVNSPYSQVSGSGWYFSGTSATFSVTDQSVTRSGTGYQFTGWTGSGPGSYGGSQSSVTLTVTAPIQETPNWQSRAAVSALTDGHNNCPWFRSGSDNRHSCGDSFS